MTNKIDDMDKGENIGKPLVGPMYTDLVERRLKRESAFNHIISGRQLNRPETLKVSIRELKAALVALWEAIKAEALNSLEAGIMKISTIFKKKVI